METVFMPIEKSTTVEDLLLVFDVASTSKEFINVGTVMEKSIALTNITEFLKKAEKIHPEFQMDIVFCRKNPNEKNSFIGFSKSDPTVECSTDPAAIGIALIARNLKTARPFCGINLIISPDFGRFIFGPETDYSVTVKASENKKEDDKDDTGKTDKSAAVPEGDHQKDGESHQSEPTKPGDNGQPGATPESTESTDPNKQAEQGANSKVEDKPAAVSMTPSVQTPKAPHQPVNINKQNHKK